jgi:GH25 family lysozyme M1 (1,4-beta-N-acetylmuramidase)
MLEDGYTTYTCHCDHVEVSDYVSYSEIFSGAYVENTAVLAKGIDVSKWNHEIGKDGEYLPLDWNLIKASGIDFVILKGGSTKNGIEPTFEMDYAGARAAGLEIGVYFYTYSTTTDGAKNDASLLLKALEGKYFEYPIYFDLEDSTLEALGKDTLMDMCTAFITTLQSNGYYAALYTNHNWITYILDRDNVVSSFDVWYARYPGTDDPVWNEEKYGKQFPIWQYSESGKIDGFSCNFDLNFSYKNYKEIMLKWGLNGFEAISA